MNKHKMNDTEIKNCIFYATTYQGTAIRTITETLKECLTDTLVKFDESGIYITDCNEKKGLITKLTLDKFDYYRCNTSDNIGLSMLSFHKLLKTVSNKDVVTLYVENSDPTNLGIIIQNKEKNTISKIKMHLRDLNNQAFTIPDMMFDHTFHIPCSEFQKILRDLCIIDSNLCFYIDKTDKGSDLILHVEGDMGSQITKIDTSDNDNNDSNINIKIEDIEDNIIGMFNLEILNLFFKASSICSNVTLYLKAGAPLIIEFKIANIGRLEFILSPLNTHIRPRS